MRLRFLSLLLQSNSAAEVGNIVDTLDMVAGAYYWWKPDSAKTNETQMQWNVQIGNRQEINTGCKALKVYSCSREMKPEGGK